MRSVIASCVSDVSALCHQVTLMCRRHERKLIETACGISGSEVKLQLHLSTHSMCLRFDIHSIATCIFMVKLCSVFAVVVVGFSPHSTVVSTM